jgi:hypothetical protein
MGKGYAEGPALEERLAAAEQGPATTTRRRLRKAVFGSTQRKRERHFLGWLGEVDPDELFSSGEAWGLSITEVADTSPKKARAAAEKPAEAAKKRAPRARKLARAS